ncbi:MAG: helix-turn-helix transcriptional regulator [Clostridiales bacterium]|nr:helix-turn-helix transcriptional regulator [Clostridiales bacterium]
MEIEKKLKEARVNAGLTQEQLAQKIMVSRQTISNWENGKSLPDIISIMNLSDLYQISLDDLLKGDPKMKEKMEKDVNTAKYNKRLILTAGILIVLVVAIYFISVLAGGAFRDFCESAVIWVLIGIGVAFSGTYFNQKE